MDFCASDPKKEKLYGGECFLLAPSTASHLLVTEIVAAIQGVFPNQDIAFVHGSHSNDSLTQKLRDIRRNIAQNQGVFDIQRAIVEEFGWDPTAFLFDHLRVRMFTPYMHTLAPAKPAFFAHRDTWYANPQQQINIWIPLFSYEEVVTFRFYPKVFGSAVVNDSHEFDYQWWKENIGFQRLNPKKSVYPKALGGLGGGCGFACAAAQRLVFSAQHLHQTRENTSARTRWSIDFRIVHRHDWIQGRGPKNVDAKATGDAAVDYR